MRNKYFEKVENKYVFNISRIFWHIFIVIGALAIVGGVLLYIYGVIPPFKQSVEKLPPPVKKDYPGAVTIALNDLQLETTKTTEKKEIQVQLKENKEPYPDQTVEKLKKIEKGETEYLLSLERLIKLIPSQGHYEYPQGAKLYEFYRDEKYRIWKDDNDLKGRLDLAFENTNARTFIDKKQMIEVFIVQLQLVPESKRTEVFNVFASNAAISVSTSINNIQTAINVFQKFPEENQLTSLEMLLSFCKSNKNDGSAFIEYFNKIIDSFDKNERLNVLATMINAYYQYFNNHILLQSEQTDLFLKMLPKIKPELQIPALNKYYLVYLEKNAGRDQMIAQIDQQYRDSLMKIQEVYLTDSLAAEYKYFINKEAKTSYRNNALYAIVCGIGLIAIIAIILVFLSIQRSVRRIEEKLVNEISTSEPAN